MTDTLYIALEAVFNRDAQGNIWSDAGFEPSFWQRYLVAFEKIAIVARMNDVSRQAPPHLIIPGEKISFVALPYYRGVGGFLGKTFGLLHRLNRISSRSGYFILRLPGAIGMLLGCLRAMRQGRFAVELVGDPYDVLSGEGFSTRDRLLRGPLTLVTKLLCRGSIGNAYVTEHTLQGRYPPAKGAYCDGISSINLPPSQFSATAKVQGGALPFRLFFCGSLAQLYKGLDVLIEAVALLKDEHRDISVTVAGDGLYRGKMEAFAKDKGVADRFIFRGQIARDDVLAALDEADMFVMPSRTEGLPRAMVEAMARGTCCIGTRVGGIPELLTDDALVPVDDAGALAGAIAYGMDNPDWMNAQAKRNLAFARKFSTDILGPRRTAFYQAVKRRTDGAIT